MRFVKTEDLKTGMRLARPIYNKKGVLLHERNTKLTSQSISSIQNFGLIGIYILEPAEPVPPMNEDDIEFERFQTINVYQLEAELSYIMLQKKTSKLEFIINDLIKTYGHRLERINFVQNLRSNEDYVYKHSLNVAILATMMCHKMNVSVTDTNETIMACLIHDIGKLMIPKNTYDKESPENIERILEAAQTRGFDFIGEVLAANPNVKRICSQTFKHLADLKNNQPNDKANKIVVGTRVMLVAEMYDSLTAVKLDGEEPKSPVEALRYLINHKDVFHPKAVEALVDSINILSPGTSVELNSGEKATVLSINPGDILHPMVLVFSTNEMIDLSNRRLYDDVEIVDIMKTMDSRHVMTNPFNQTDSE